MDKKMLQPFINATLNVLETMASTSATVGEPYMKKDKTAKGDVSGVIGLTGAFNGTLSVSFTEPSILAVVSNMFGEEMTEVDEEIKDAVGEITNMISGQARQELEELGYSLDSAIPSVIGGKGHTIKHITSFPIIAIPFQINDTGDFSIELCLETVDES